MVQFVRDKGEFPFESIQVFEHFKNGKLRKTASNEIRHDHLTYELGAMPDGSVIPINVRPRQKMFSVRGKRKSGEWKDLGAALHAFLLNTGIVVE